MNKILHIPLDERPCNYEFPKQIFQGGEWEILTLPFSYLGLKKKPAQIEKIQQWVLNNYQSAYGIVISIDMLLYGGIVPSRIHYFSFEELKERLNILKLIKSKRPDFKIYAYNLVMRCPQYNDDDEEPSYYQNYGLNIFRRKYIEHKKSLNIATNEELEEEKQIFIPEEFVLDYETRRMTNLQVVLEVINLVKENIIDFLIIPQDDSAPYGYTALDQAQVAKKVNDNKLFFKILTYPGADEVSNTLFARLLNEYYNKRPLVYLFYPAEKAKTVIPCAEDRYLDISAKYQILAAGCLFTPSLKDADLIFAINAPSKTMISSQFRESSDDGYSVNRNLLDFVNFIDYCINVLNKPVCIGDVGYCNGGDLALITLIEQKKMYLKLAGYASWNIPCNSLGTALPMGIRYLYPHDQQLFNNFLIHRFVEDVGYCTLARKILREQYCNDEFSIYDTKQMRGKFSELAKKIIIEQVNKYMPTLKDKYKILDAYMPWIRTYEIGLKVIYTGDNDE